jgi:hypothetical protein
MAAAVTTAAAPGRTGTAGAIFGDAHANLAAVNVFAVQFADRCICGVFVSHFNEAETFGLVGTPVFDHRHGDDFAVGFEKTPQGVFIRVVVQIAYIDFLSHFLSFAGLTGVSVMYRHKTGRARFLSTVSSETNTNKRTFSGTIDRERRHKQYIRRNKKCQGVCR